MRIIKAYCDICGKEIKSVAGSIDDSLHTIVDVHKFTKRKDGHVLCDWASNTIRKGCIDLQVCHKCGDKIEKAITDTYNKIKEETNA